MKIRSLLMIMGLAGCGVHAPARQASTMATATATAPLTPVRVEDGMVVQGGRGEMDEEQADEQVREHMGEINRCYQEVAGRLRFLSGKLVMKMTVDRDGLVKAAAVAQSTLGNYEVERCVGGVAREIRFAPPKGGEAELLYPIEFPLRARVAAWPEARVASQMQRHKGELGVCEKGSGQKPAALRMTLYIGPGGRVCSAGLAADEPIDERLGHCLVARAQGWRFDDPLGQMVKTTYAFD